MRSIYKSKEGKKRILRLYDQQLKRLGVPYKDITIPTSDDIYQTAKLSIDYAKIKKIMPSNVSKKRMQNCKAPALVMAAELDCLFPGSGVIARAEDIMTNCRTYLLKGRGHMSFLTEEEKKMMVDFLL